MGTLSIESGELFVRGERTAVGAEADALIFTDKYTSHQQYEAQGCVGQHSEDELTQAHTREGIEI